ncbi:MAG: ABA4-like family protein [Alphaproteobacteria bacterium]
MEPTATSDLIFGIGWETWFSHAGMVAMAGWAVLALAPRRWPLLNAVPAVIAPAILSIGYAVLILRYFWTVDGGFDSLASVAMLFQSEPLLLAGWIHYLAFDLFIGAWIARKCDAAQISRLIQVPILFATFMFGPIGLLIYMVIRAGRDTVATRLAAA